MTAWDPRILHRLSGDGEGDSGESLELPLEVYFAEDRGAPEAVAARTSLESAVLDRMASSRGFVSPRGRRLVTLGRVAIAGVVVLGLLGAAVADRLGVAPWNSEASEGPLAGLVASASEETAGEIERVRELRQGLLRVVTLPSPVSVLEGSLQRVDAGWGSAVPERGSPGVSSSAAAGPYLSAKGLESTTVRTSVVIRFEDGFSVPAMAGEAGSELRWPASREVSSSLVSLDGVSGPTAARGLSPAWYARSGPDSSR